MKNKKGFTLVELLAVIVILAVIALIATPAILKLINDSRESAAEDSMYGYIKAVENAYVKSQINPGAADYKGKTYTVLGRNSIATGSGAEGVTTLSDIDLQGTAPTNDAGNTLVIDAEGSIQCAIIKFGNYYVNYVGATGSANASSKASDAASPACTLAS